MDFTKNINYIQKCTKTSRHKFFSVIRLQICIDALCIILQIDLNIEIIEQSAEYDHPVQ